MELRHLRTLVAVARHRSFTKAADELHLAQSAVSQHVRRLEDELGVAVLRRTSRTVEVTPEGRVVLDYAKRVLDEVEGLRDELDEFAGLLRGRIAVGATYPYGTYDLPAICAEFRHRHPGVEIHMREETPDTMIAMLRADELDCAFAAVDPDTLGDDLAATLVWHEEFVVAAPRGHHFEDRACVTLEELAEEDLIAYRENSALRHRLEAIMAARGLAPRNAIVCTEMAAVRAFASRGLGVTVIPRAVAVEEGPEIVLRPIGPEPLTWPIALVWRARRRQPPAAKAFLALALDYAAKQEAAQAEEALAA